MDNARPPDAGQNPAGDEPRPAGAPDASETATSAEPLRTDAPLPPSDSIAQVPPPDPDRPGQRPSLSPELEVQGPLTRQAAGALLDRAAEMMSSGDFQEAALHYRRVVGFDDAAVTAAALLGLGQALYRLDEEEAAVATWESVLELPETPSTYRAWREVAAARVRSRDLNGAIAAYRQADRRAPPEDKPEIANRLGWLAKETGNRGASKRYFAKGRGAGPAFPLPWLVIGLTVVVSFMAITPDGFFLYDLLQLDKEAVARGEYWRLFSVTLLHSPVSLLHLVFNMYALFLSGPIVEQLYGSRLFLVFYLLCAAAGSTASFVFGGDIPAVGASGAIFGLFGLLLAASRTHNPVLDQRSRSLVRQLGMLIVINLAFGFAVPNIDNAAHIGGLVAGLWLGFLFVPGRVPTLRTFWQGTTDGARRAMGIPALGVAALVAVIVIGVVVGTEMRAGPGVAAGDPTAVVEVREP